jgi:predicted dehydrogenase
MSAAKKTYRVGVIGHTGRGNYGHGLDRVWLEIPETQIVAVADPHEAGRKKEMETLGVETGYADYREMLEHEKLDIVAVCPRWIDQHHAMLTAAAEHGCHVYTEKPFCRTLAEADEVVRAFEMRHLKLAIAHIARYSPQLAIVKKLIADGGIGDVLEIRGRGKEDARGGGEDLWVLGSHALDLMRAIGGEARWCFARVTVGGRPVTKADVAEGNEGIGPLAGDGIEAMYRFENGATGTFSSHKNAGGRPSRFGLTIYGTKGVIEFPPGFLHPAFLLKESSWSAARTGGKWIPITSNGIGEPETRSDFDYRGALPVMTRDLLAAIEEDRQPQSGLEDARASVEMIAAIFESHRTGGPAEFPLKNRENPLTMLEA